MDDVKLCATCQHKNPLDATTCARCGVPLVALLPARTTVRVPDSLRDLSPPPPKVVKRTDDALSVYIVGQKQPLIIPGEVTKINFGRLSPGESSPTVDLTPYDAHLFGVSRQHATVFRTENGIFLQDHESTNGSWLNDHKLIPHKLYEVKSGDLIRLGQLGMRLYFETRASEYVILLTDETTPSIRLTPAYLESRVSPYLVAIANLQGLIDSMLDRPLSIVTVQSITVDDQSRIAVGLAGARDVIRMMDARLRAWRSARGETIDKLRALSTALKTTQSDSDALQALRTESGPLRREVREQLGAFARAWVDDTAPSTADGVRAAYTSKLVIPLQALLFSPLQPANAAKIETAPVTDKTVTQTTPVPE